MKAKGRFDGDSRYFPVFRCPACGIECRSERRLMMHFKFSHASKLSAAEVFHELRRSRIDELASFVKEDSCRSM